MIQDDDKFGNTDGSFNNKEIFTCPKKKGMFVSVDKLEAKLSSSLLEEYSKQSALGLAPSRTFKITFVGPEGSGKTSSIKTLLGKKFDKYELSTIGAILGIQTIINWFKSNENTEDNTSFELQSSHAIGWRETSALDVQKVLEKEYVKEMSSKLKIYQVKLLLLDLLTIYLNQIQKLLILRLMLMPKVTATSVITNLQILISIRIYQILHKSLKPTQMLKK